MTIEIISRAEAKARGLVRYFTGKPCKHNHITERIVANGCCVECRKNIDKRWIDANPEKVREKRKLQSRRHRLENPDRIKNNRKKWEVANPDKVQERVRRWERLNLDRRREIGDKWAKANPDKIRKKNRTYKTTNAERLAPINRQRVSDWVKANPEKKRKHVNDRRAREHNAIGSHTVEELKEQLERQDHLCIGCYADLSGLRNRTIDHIMALSKGGSQWIANIQWLCQPCNSRKHDKSQIEWLCETARVLW